MADDDRSSGESSLESESDEGDDDEEEEEEEGDDSSLAGTTKTESPATKVESPQLQHLTEGLEKLWLTGAHSDIKIHAGEKVFSCHKAVLLATSPYFDAMFSSGMRESISGEITFKEMEAKTCQLVLEYIYTGKEVVTQDNVIKLLKASSLLQIKSLCEKCEAILVPYIELDNCIDIWKLSLIHSWEKVKARGFQLILAEFMQLVKTRAFLRLDSYELIQIIKEDSLNVPSEEDVCDAVSVWSRGGDQASRQKKLGQIFANIRLGLLSPERLVQLKADSSPVGDSQTAQRAVDEALQYQLLPARRQESASLLVQRRSNSTTVEVLIVMGGCSFMLPPYKRCHDVLAYSFAQQKWFKIASLPYDPGIEFATCTFGNDIYLSGGGSKTQTFLKYKADKNKWKIGKPLCQGRRRHVMAAITNALYVLGGYDHRTGEGSKMLPTIEKYDFSEDAWEETCQLSIPVSSFSSAVSGEKVFLFGGEKNDKTDTGIIQCYDARTNQCTEIANLAIISKLTKAVSIDKRIFIIFFSGKIVEYNQSDSSCKVKGTIKAFRRIHYGAVQYRGDIYIVGGENEDTSLTKEMIRFKVDLCETEKSGTPLPGPRLIDSCVKIALHKQFLTDEATEYEAPEPQEG